MSTVYGRFERPTGKVTLDRAAKTGSIEVKIPTATISSGDGKRADGQRSRDEHLRAADFFNVAEFPEMVYKSTKFNFAGDKMWGNVKDARRSRRTSEQATLYGEFSGRRAK